MLPWSVITKSSTTPRSLKYSKDAGRYEAIEGRSKYSGDSTVVSEMGTALIGLHSSSFDDEEGELKS